jgi:hypothetical protein
MPNTDWMKYGGLMRPLSAKCRSVYEVPDVVALDLEARVVRAAGVEDVLDVLEGVLEDAVVGLRRGTGAPSRT